MGSLTSRLKLNKPATTDLIDVGSLNANSDVLDQNPGVFICTSTTRPASPFTGQHIYETDTANELTWDGSGWIYTTDNGATAVLDLGASWVVGTGWAPPRLIRVGKTVFMTGSYVHRSGTAAGFTAGGAYYFATVPDGFRPASSTNLGGFSFRASDVSHTGYLRVNSTDGNFGVVSYNAATMSTNHSASHLPIPTCMWRL